ncbi:MAG TPA: thioesterase family protein [Vicinamibacterales bacterium]|nr:thioesterase family protein [Vicinamibacterales bacterium]
MFEKRYVAGWGDMDFNSHMRNTSFLDKSADVQMMCFSENGFPMDEFIRRKIGPVIMKDEIEYFRENRLLEELRVTLVVAFSQVVRHRGSNPHIESACGG